MRIADYSVGELAALSGITVRTLHHFDRIGLLRPVRTGSGAYRRYARADLERLQEILFYRAAGLPLRQIAALLADGRPAARAARLTAHLARLEAEADHLTRTLATLRRTIAMLNGETTMTDKDLYAPFAPAVQAAHEDWLVARDGPEMAAASPVRIRRLPPIPAVCLT